MLGSAVLNYKIAPVKLKDPEYIRFESLTDKEKANSKWDFPKRFCASLIYGSNNFYKDERIMTHAETLLSCKTLIEGMLKNEALVKHHEKLEAIRELLVSELAKPKPVMDEYLEQIIASILLPIKKESNKFK